MSDCALVLELGRLALDRPPTLLADPRLSRLFLGGHIERKRSLTMTEKPCIICVAITGSLPKKSDNPAVPITVAEQVDRRTRPSRPAPHRARPRPQRRRRPTSDPGRSRGSSRACAGTVRG